MVSHDVERILQNAALKLQAGKHLAALKAAKAALKKFPKEPRLLDLAGVAAQDAGDVKTAAHYFMALHKLIPKNTDVRFKLGVALAQSNTPALAEKVIGGWIAEAPENPTYRFLSALTATAAGDHEEAEAQASRALDLNPRMERALAIRGLARFQMNRFESALADFEHANEIEPDNSETLLNIGLSLRALRRSAEAITVFRRCASLNPGAMEPKINLAEVLEQSGALSEAREVFLDVLENAPGNWQALSRLVALNTKEQNIALEETVRGAQKLLKKNDRYALTANHVLAGLLSSIGKNAEADTFYDRANAFAATYRPYDPDAAEDDLRKTVEMFSNALPTSSTTPQNPKPIFIIGQPRSGTTLLELMLAANPKVLSLGELGAIEEPALAALNIGTFDPSKHAASYRDELPARAAECDAFIDKTPANYRFVGFLAEAFPDAVFVHLQRDPRDVALSMWKAQFKGWFYTYAARLDWMAHAANLYQRYMAEWSDRYGTRIINVRYQDLVEMPQDTIKQIADFCGVDWVAGMAAPEKSTTTIETSSILQARKPVHAKSLGKWRSHEAFLEPFVAGLDPALWPEVFEGS